MRKENGVTGASVHRDAKDPNTVIIVHRFEDVETAQALLDSEELQLAMVEAGVSRPPEIWLGEDVEETSY